MLQLRNDVIAIRHRTQLSKIGRKPPIKGVLRFIVTLRQGNLNDETPILCLTPSNGVHLIEKHLGQQRRIE